MSLEIENLKFTIFGSGHDYTRLDSGDGNVRMFSHPFVPLNSVNYAGQYFFLVPDENGEPIDAVKDDIAHCTFDPPLGTAFDTEGETTVKVTYYREYIYPEETILVEKELEEVVTVVDHGQVATPAFYSAGTWYGSDIYEDGYCFMRPRNVNDLADISLATTYAEYNIKSFSSLWWRITQIGWLSRCRDLEDVTELQYADVSNVISIDGLITNSQHDIDLTPLEGWDVSNVTTMVNLLYGCQNLTSLHGLEDWDVSKVASLAQAFKELTSITDFEPLKDWKTSSLESLNGAFSSCGASSLHGLEDWDVSHVSDLKWAFAQCDNLVNVDPLIKWDTVTETMQSTFYGCDKLKDLHGLANLNLSHCTTLQECFEGLAKLISLDGLENWDVSNVENFYQTFFGNAFLADISALADWDVSSGLNFNRMFGNGAFVLSVDALANWDVSNATDMSGMFTSFGCGHSSALNKNLWYNNMHHYFDYDGNMYGGGGLGTWTEFTKDASGVNDWTPGVTPAGVFSNNWSNIPAWN